MPEKLHQKTDGSPGSRTERARLENSLKEAGFGDFAWINPGHVIVAQWVRVKCTFGCSDYGSGSCPPNTPTVEACREFFAEYNSGVMIRMTVDADRHDYPLKWSTEMTARLLALEKEVFFMNYPKTFLLNQSCCTLCSACPGSRKDCTHKIQSRPSPEAFAVDVYSTAENAGLKINVITESPSVIHRIAILLIK